MILSNFMRKNVKRKAKVPKSEVPQLRQPQSPIKSPSFTTSPEEVFDINERSIDSRMVEDSGSEKDISVDRRPSASSSHTRLNVAYSLVQLDYNPEPLEDWFPQELLSGKRGSHDSGWSLHMSSVPEQATAEATAP